jgi:hypothetical protein
LNAENDMLAKDLMSLKQMKQEERHLNEVKKSYENDSVNQ